MTVATIPTRTAWTDELHALRERIDSFPLCEHPALRGLLNRYEAHMQLGLSHEYITPREAARA